MNSLVIFLFSAAWLVFAYLWYGKRRIERRLIEPLDEQQTPAYTKADGIDYCPAPKMVLFGHHFSSIAGAGPIVGPIVAVSIFGWGPAVLWLLFAGVFIGAVHDYLVLMMSERNGGASVADTTGKCVSMKARMLFLIFVWFTLILVVAVFANLAAKAMISQPELVIPTFMLIPLAIIFGILNKKNILPLWLNTIFAIAALIGLIWGGFVYPVNIDMNPESLYVLWFSLLMLYGIVASVTPVWILLQPRDYISSWVLVIAVILAGIGVFVVHPDMTGPVVTSFSSEKNGPMIPFIFIIIACGAVSGFHSLVAGGTTSKQINKEKDALPIAYGGMLTETIIGIICVIIAAGALSWGTDQGSLHQILRDGGALAVFGNGFGKLTYFIFGTRLGSVIGIVVVNVFIMTTLDTCVRLTRFITGEMIGEKMGSVGKNKYFLTILPVIPAFLLGVTDSWKAVWPLFGAANQLVAALALITVTAWLYSRGKSIKYTLWATIFMLISTATALCWLVYDFFVVKNSILLGSLSFILIVLAVLMTIEGIGLIKKSRKDVSGV